MQLGRCGSISAMCEWVGVGAWTSAGWHSSACGFRSKKAVVCRSAKFQCVHLGLFFVFVEFS